MITWLSQGIPLYCFVKLKSPSKKSFTPAPIFPYFQLLMWPDCPNLIILFSFQLESSFRLSFFFIDLCSYKSLSLSPPRFFSFTFSFLGSGLFWTGQAHWLFESSPDSLLVLALKDVLGLWSISFSVVMENLFVNVLVSRLISFK